MDAEIFAGDAVEGGQVGAGADRVHGRLLRAEHQLVELPLPAVEPPGDRDRPGDVGRVVPELGAHVHDDQLPGPGLPPVLVVMEGGRVGSGAHDGRKPQPLGATPAESVLDQPLELVLEHARSGRPHRLVQGLGGDADGAAQTAELVLVLDLPERIQLGGEILDPRRGARAEAGGGAPVLPARRTADVT